MALEHEDIKVGGQSVGLWQPPPLNLGSGAVSGVLVYLKDAGNYYSFNGGNYADKWSANINLNHDGIPYDGSNLALKISYKLSANGGASDTVFWDCNYAFLKAGDNGQTESTALTRKVVDVSSEVQDINFSTQLNAMTGVVNATCFSIDFTRSSLSAGGDAFSGNA